MNLWIKRIQMVGKTKVRKKSNLKLRLFFIFLFIICSYIAFYDRLFLFYAYFFLIATMCTLIYE